MVFTVLFEKAGSEQTPGKWVSTWKKLGNSDFGYTFIHTHLLLEHKWGISRSFPVLVTLKIPGKFLNNKFSFENPQFWEFFGGSEFL